MSKGGRPRKQPAAASELSSPNPEMEAMRKELALLRQQLSDAELKAKLYNEIINVAEKQFGISIRKKAGTKQ